MCSFCRIWCNQVLAFISQIQPAFDCKVGKKTTVNYSDYGSRDLHPKQLVTTIQQHLLLFSLISEVLFPTNDGLKTALPISDAWYFNTLYIPAHADDYS